MQINIIMIEIASFQHNMVDYTLPSMTQRVTYFLDSFNTNNVDLLTCIQIKKSSTGADGKANNLEAFIEFLLFAFRQCLSI